MIPQPELGTKISKLRNEQGFTQSELAERCNVSLRTIQRIESGEVVPRAYTTKLILSELGIEKDSMIKAPSRKTIIKAGIIILIISAGSAFLISVTEEQNAQGINGWYITGSNPKNYIMGIDQSEANTGKSSGYIQSVSDDQEGFGAPAQSSSPTPYLGKKIKMTAYIKTQNVTNYAGIWLRADSRSLKKSLAFKNTAGEPIKGTTNWSKREITLDIPQESETLIYGFILSGSGKIWFDDLSFDILGDMDRSSSNPNSNLPRNTDFEK